MGCGRVALVVFWQVVVFDESHISIKIAALGRMQHPVVQRQHLDFDNGMIGVWIFVRFILYCAGLRLCSPCLVDDLVESGQFAAGVDAKVIVDVVRKNMLHEDGTLRFGIDEIEVGRIAIRIFPSRLRARAASFSASSSLSSGSVGQQVEAYIEEACRRSRGARRPPPDDGALVPCALLSHVCSACCVAFGPNFGGLMSRCR